MPIYIYAGTYDLMPKLMDLFWVKCALSITTRTKLNKLLFSKFLWYLINTLKYNVKLSSWVSQGKYNWARLIRVDFDFFFSVSKQGLVDLDIFFFTRANEQYFLMRMSGNASKKGIYLFKWCELDGKLEQKNNRTIECVSL